MTKFIYGSKRNERKKEKKESKVMKEQTYTIILTTYDDGKSSLKRTNNGFSAIELLGMTSLISLEVKEQLMGTITPDFIKREVVVD
jgi:ArsR family metal-binding transcriptional regulator